MNYREHRIPTSLSRHVGDAPMTDGELRALVARALRMGVIVFLKDDVEKMDWMERGVIEGAARRIYGRGKTS